MSEKEYIGEFSTTFKGRKPEEGDVLSRGSRKRNKAKGQTISGAAKMKAAYKARRAKKSSR